MEDFESDGYGYNDSFISDIADLLVGSQDREAVKSIIAYDMEPDKIIELIDDWGDASYALLDFVDDAGIKKLLVDVFNYYDSSWPGMMRELAKDVLDEKTARRTYSACRGRRW